MPPQQRRQRWPNLISESNSPTAILSPSKRLRMVNDAWLKLTGLKLDDVIDHPCLRTSDTDDIFKTMAPPREAKLAITTIRRAMPGKRTGPPWWDMTFVPLPQTDGRVGYLIKIDAMPVSMPGEKSIVPQSVIQVREQHAKAFSFEWFQGTSPIQKKFTQQLKHAAQSMAPVWLIGESGSGKETAARAIHRASPVRDRAFFGLDCAGSPSFLAESILFGRGSFGESGRLGTLFLKEPNAMPRDAQVQLLKWLESAGQSVRLISASESTAAVGVQAKSLVPDFVSRYSTIELTMPTLRDCKDHLPAIVDHLCTRLKRTITNQAIDVLKQHLWPGNHRELHDTLALIELAEGQPIKLEHLPRSLRETVQLKDSPPPKTEPGPNLDQLLEEVERRLLQVALKSNHDNATKAADWLGIARTRFLRRVETLKTAQKAD